MRSLRAVKGHEQGAEHDAERAGYRGPQRAQTNAGTNKTDGHGEECEVTQKPEWPLPGQSVGSFAIRNEIDRMTFDRAMLDANYRAFNYFVCCLHHVPLTAMRG